MKRKRQGGNRQPTSYMTNTEKEIAQEIARANGVSVTKLGLRFDGVVVRLLGSLRASLAQEKRKETVVMTITAPIRFPAKTAVELAGEIRNLLASGARGKDHSTTVFENRVCIRIVPAPSRSSAQFIGLVHNPDINAVSLLDLATHWLTKD